MALFVKQNEPRSQLQEKIAADLADRLKNRQVQAGADKPQPAILDDQQQTSSLAWLWLVLFAVVAGAVIWLAVR